MRISLWLWCVCLIAGFPTCGLAADGKDHRERHDIRGGEPTALGEHLFGVYIDIGSFYCTGSLISPTWVLTAAHCVTYDDGTPVPAEDIGAIESGYPEYYERNTSIKRLAVHPNYRSSGSYAPFVNDAALIELGTPFANPLIKPVRVLNREEEARYAPSGTVATLLGWGGQSDRLLQVESPMYLGTDCHAIFDPSQSRWGVEDTKNMMHKGTICTGDTSKGSDSGDSGGPLIVPLGRNAFAAATWGLVGVTSHSITNHQNEPFVAISTRVSTVHDWIDNTIRPLTILTHAFAGPLASSTAKTEITITNRAATACAAAIQFHQGTAEPPPVKFNGRHPDNNTLEISIPGGTTHHLTMTRDAGQDLAVGAVYIQADQECAADSLQIESRYVITRQDGEIMEAFSVLPQTENDWLSDGDCRILAGNFGPNSNVGLAMVTTTPEMAAPADTRLTFQVYDWQGQFVDEPPSLEVTGVQHALNPWSFKEPRLVRMCLDVPEDNGFRLSLIAIAASSSRRNVQYSSQALIPLN